MICPHCKNHIQIIKKHIICNYCKSSLKLVSSKKYLVAVVFLIIMQYIIMTYFTTINPLLVLLVFNIVGLLIMIRYKFISKYIVVNDKTNK